METFRVAVNPDFRKITARGTGARRIAWLAGRALLRFPETKQGEGLIYRRGNFHEGGRDASWPTCSLLAGHPVCKENNVPGGRTRLSRRKRPEVVVEKPNKALPRNSSFVRTYRCTRQVAGRNPEQVFTKPAVAFLSFLSIPYISSLLPPCFFSLRRERERETDSQLPLSLFIYSFGRSLFPFAPFACVRVYASSSGGPHPSRHFDEHSN